MPSAFFSECAKSASCTSVAPTRAVVLGMKVLSSVVSQRGSVRSWRPLPSPPLMPKPLSAVHHPSIHRCGSIRRCLEVCHMEGRASIARFQSYFALLRPLAAPPRGLLPDLSLCTPNAFFLLIGKHSRRPELLRGFHRDTFAKCGSCDTLPSCVTRKPRTCELCKHRVAIVEQSRQGESAFTPRRAFLRCVRVQGAPLLRRS